MTPRDLEKLLGGYMTGTLTESEHGELMRAAVDDQQLFDALADEEALRDALADPVFRARLRARLAPAAPDQRSLRWMWWLAPVMAAGLALVFVLNRPAPERPTEMAAVKSAPQLSQPVPQASDKEAPAAKSVLVKQPEPAPRQFVPPTAIIRNKPAPATLPPPPPPPSLAAPPTTLGAITESVAVTANAPVVFAEKKASRDEAAPAAAAELRKAAAETDALASAALDLQVERAIDGRFESTELGALRQGDRVRFRVRAPESGTLVMTAGPAIARSTLAEAGRIYYLPDANGLPPGDSTLEVAIALRPTLQGERGAAVFRARQSASNASAASALGGAAPAAPPPPPMRDARREDSKAKEQAAPKQEAASARLAQAVLQTAPRTVLLRLEFKPR